MEKRFYSGVADLAFNEKSGAVLAVSRRQSDITRWNMGVDGKGQPLPGQDNYRDQIDNFLGKFSVRASARTTADLVLKYSDRKETLVSNLFRETRWDNNHAARGISVNIDHQFQGGRYSLQAGWDRALSNRVSVGDELVTFQPGPAAIYGGRLRQGTEAAGQLDPQRPRRPGSGAHRRNHAHPLRRPGMAAGAGRVRTLPAIAFLPSRLRQQGRLPGLQQGPLPARHRGRELRQRQRVSVRPHRMGTAGPGRRRAL